MTPEVARDKAGFRRRIQAVIRTARGLVSLLVVVTVAACGSHSTAKLARGVIEVRSGVSGSSLRHSVLGITIGTSASDVRRKLGDPFARVSSQGQSCWAYHASQPGTALDALDFCIDKGGKVARILTGVHT
jgi:hypothetical protein